MATKESVDSDIEIKVTLKDNNGNTLDASEGKIEWQVKVDSTVYEGNTGSAPSNCYYEDGIIVITIPSNTFKVSKNTPLSLRIKTITDNAHFEDGTKDVWGEWIKTTLQLY